ncbi:MAG: glycerophosphodiester phosphodiesterase [Chloroflexota bacterium]|nr:glycerophosphodiester phosphodiesterase [Chloroflexota bacterium]
MSSPITVCHRGASALAAENSLDAFRMAMEHGVDFSELDVHVAQDGELVVTHDAVADARLERALPRLAEVFDLVRGRMGIYVELKGERTGLALGELIRRGAASAVRLISGSAVLELVTELRVAAPEVPRSILFRPGWDVRGMIGACRELGAAYAHPCFRPIEASMVAAFHDAGLLVMTPHTNEAAEAAYFVRIGADVIASDDPRVLGPLQGFTTG